MQVNVEATREQCYGSPRSKLLSVAQRSVELYVFALWCKGGVLISYKKKHGIITRHFQTDRCQPGLPSVRKPPKVLISIIKREDLSSERWKVEHFRIACVKMLASSIGAWRQEYCKISSTVPVYPKSIDLPDYSPTVHNILYDGIYGTNVRLSYKTEVSIVSRKLEIWSQ